MFSTSATAYNIFWKQLIEVGWDIFATTHLFPSLATLTIVIITLMLTWGPFATTCRRKLKFTHPKSNAAEEPRKGKVRKNANLSADPTRKEWAQLKSLLTSHGASLSQIDIQETPDSRRMIATSSIQAGSAPVVIPRKLVISVSRARQSLIGKRLEEMAKQRVVRDSTVLQAYLLHLKCGKHAEHSVERVWQA